MTAIVTGAGSGIGKRLCELLLERGQDVIALDLRFSASAECELDAAADTGAARVLRDVVDVRSGEDVQRAVDAGVQELGALRLAVNCAGVALAKAFDATNEEEYRRVVDINLYGSRNFAAATLPHLAGGGQLVLVASIAGFVGSYGYSAYCASKFGVLGLAEVLRLEQKPKGVTVSVVAPPEIVTPMVEEERRSGSAVTGKMKQFAGSLELEPAVREILAGIDAGKFLIVPGYKARQTILLQRFAPRRLTQRVSDRLLARAIGKA